MAELEVEAGWREELKRDGEAQFRNPRNVGMTEEPKGQVSLRRCGDEAGSRRLERSKRTIIFNGPPSPLQRRLSSASSSLA